MVTENLPEEESMQGKIQTAHGVLHAEGSLLFRYEGTDTELILPKEISTVFTYAFSGNQSLKHVHFLSHGAIIEYGAFNGCSNLEKVTGEGDDYKVDPDAFLGCSGLIDAHGYLSVLGTLCQYLGEESCLQLPDDVRIISYKFCQERESIETVICGDKVEIIGGHAFSGCSNLQSVELGKSIRQLGRKAFADCERLQKISDMTTVRKIGTDVLQNCPLLETITFSDQLQDLGAGSFCGCSGLADNEGRIILEGRLQEYKTAARRAEVPGSVRVINSGAFSNLETLESVVCLPGVQKICHEAFHHCLNLRQLTLPETVEQLGSDIFPGTKGVEIYARCPMNPALKNYKEAAARGFSRMLAEGDAPAEFQEAYFSYMKRRRKHLDMNCLPLLTVMTEQKLIPPEERELFLEKSELCTASRQLLEEYFDRSEPLPVKKHRAPRLRSADAPPTAEELRKIWTTRKRSDGTLEITGCKSDAAEITVPSVIGRSQVTSVGRNSFSRKRSLQRIVLPEGISAIDEAAFYFCDNLKEVSLPESLTVIGDFAFSACEKLKEMHIPSSVKQIGGNSFSAEGSPLRIQGQKGKDFWFGIKPAVLTIFGKKDTFAEQYAKENGIRFELES